MLTLFFREMKNRHRFYIAPLVLAMALTLLGCEKDDETAHVSRVTTYPVITMSGEEWNVIAQGESFTDPGATAMEGEAQIEYTTTGSVDTNTPGVYVITYAAVNSDGFSTSATRKIGVISPEAAAIDLSGEYQRNAGAGGVSTVTMLAPGFYQTDNVGGVAEPGPATTVRFYHYDVNELGVPPQDVLGSTFSAVDATVIPGESYSWIVINSGYGDALRTFVKL